MAISDTVIAQTLSAYLAGHPDDVAVLSEPARWLAQTRAAASRGTYPLHVTVGALLVREHTEILLIRHRAYGLLLQPGGHLEPADTTLIGAALRELTEETGIDPALVVPAGPDPVYIEHGAVPARPDIDEPTHFHLDFGYAFTTTGDIGPIQESEVTAAARLVGARVVRARSAQDRLRRQLTSDAG